MRVKERLRVRERLRKSEGNEDSEERDVFYSGNASRDVDDFEPKKKKSKKIKNKNNNAPMSNDVSDIYGPENESGYVDNVGVKTKHRHDNNNYNKFDNNFESDKSNIQIKVNKDAIIYAEEPMNNYDHNYVDRDTRKVCHFYLANKCKKGKGCNFKHA